MVQRSRRPRAAGAGGVARPSRGHPFSALATACGGHRPASPPPVAPPAGAGRPPALETTGAPQPPAVSIPATVRVLFPGQEGVRVLPLEDYVAGVTAGEMAVGSLDPRVAGDVLALQSILARTYAIANLGRHAREGYDLCTTTHCQVFRAPERVPASEPAAGARGGRPHDRARSDLRRTPRADPLPRGLRRADQRGRADLGRRCATVPAIGARRHLRTRPGIGLDLLGHARPTCATRSTRIARDRRRQAPRQRLRSCRSTRRDGPNWWRSTASAARSCAARSSGAC